MIMNNNSANVYNFDVRIPHPHWYRRKRLNPTSTSSPKSIPRPTSPFPSKTQPPLARTVRTVRNSTARVASIASNTSPHTYGQRALLRWLRGLTQRSCLQPVRGHVVDREHEFHGGRALRGLGGVVNLHWECTCATRIGSIESLPQENHQIPAHQTDGHGNRRAPPQRQRHRARVPADRAVQAAEVELATLVGRPLMGRRQRR